ncbi:MAG: DinB family protein [Nonlabens sp.]|nr:DinB family protein [Nonlabens sp.]
MTTTSFELAARLQELFLDGSWIANTNYKKALSQVTTLQAQHKVQDFNSIAQLTFHINYYLQGILNLFDGGDLNISDKYSMPEITHLDDASWHVMVAELVGNANIFIAHVRNMDEKTLAGVFVKKQYGSYKRNIEAVLEHGYYHLGQIVLLQKIIANQA